MSDPAPAGTVRLEVTGPTRTATLVLPAGDHITLAIQRSGSYYERELLDAIRARRTGGTFVDVGAHFGNHTTFFALECAAEHVVAIEPNPPTYAGLVHNLSVNGLAGTTTAVAAAIHPEWRQVTVSVPSWEPRPDSPAASNTGMARVGPATGGAEAVPAMPLDEAVGERDEVAVVKVDVEGGALGVVESGMRTLARHRPLLVIEVLADDEQERLERLLAPLGYRPEGPWSWTPTYIWTPA